MASTIELIKIWVIGTVLLFIIGLLYFTTYEAFITPVAELFTIIADSYAAGDITHDPGNMAYRLENYWKFAHIIIGSGIVIWMILQSVKKEEFVYE